MKCNFSLLVLGVNCLLSFLFVGRSGAGVGNAQCEDGNFYDRSKHQHVPCSECTDELQECFSCCQLHPDAQGKRSNTSKVTSPKSHSQSQNTFAQRKAKLSSSEGADFLPNILVVSIVGFFIGVSSLVVLLVVLKSSKVCRREAGERASVSDSQRDDIVTEVMVMEPPCDSV